MRRALPRRAQRHTQRLLQVGLMLALALPGAAGAGESKPEPEPARIAPSESDDTASEADAPRTTLKSLTTLASFQFFPEKESKELVLQEFSGVDELNSRAKRRHSKMKLIRYDRRLQFRESEVLLKIRTPGKRKSLMSLELKF